MSTRFDDDLELDDFDDAAQAEEGSGTGLELIGGALFLVGCLPAAAVGKALFDGTNLSAEGLGGTAALAAGVAKWVGPWPALVVACAIAFVGARMVLGALRSDPLRQVAGAVVSGLGLAAILSALEVGAGGRLGDGTGGALGTAIGAWAGVLLGLAVIGASLWLAFADGSADREYAEDEDRDVRDVDAPTWRDRAAAAIAGTATTLSSITKRDRSAGRSGGPNVPSIGDRGNRRKRVAAKPRRKGEPITIGDALTYHDHEGVTHDEAEALAPDDRTLAYMEDVWRRAAQSLEQPEPIPPSPYPEDVRLKGEIPPGTAPLDPTKFSSSSTESAEAEAPAEPTPAPVAQAAPTPDIAPVQPTANDPFAADIAPFDFDDELSAPQPYVAPTPAPAAGPFTAGGATHAPMENDTRAYDEAARREGATGVGPRELPIGVKPLRAEAPSAEPTIDEVHAQAAQAGAMPAEATMPPRPSWEMANDVEDEVEIPDVDPSGRWQRRDEPIVEPEPAVEEAAELDPEGELVSSKVAPIETVEEALALIDSMTAGVVDEEEQTPEAAVEAPEEMVAEPEVEAAVEAEPEVDEEPEAEVEDELEAELEEDEEAELEDDAEAELDEESELEDEDAEAEAEDVEYEVEDDEEAELEDGEEADDEDAEAAELEAEDEAAEDEAEEVEAAEDEDVEYEYEYVDEDGNPIDPSEIDEDEFEVVAEEDDVEYEEADDDEEDDDDDGDATAEYDEADDEEDEDEEEVDGEAWADADEYEDAEEEEEADEEVAAEAAELEEERDELDDEPEVVLDPQPAPEDATRLYQAGRVVVREGRVAVSVLQREFDLEFDAACSLLDELQNEGLIGPYQGGKKREILLSEDEWEDRFVTS